MEVRARHGEHETFSGPSIGVGSASAGPRSRLQERREAVGLSQLGLATAGLSRQSRRSINAIEAGRSMPSVDVALRLARTLGSSVEDVWAVVHDSRGGSAVLRQRFAIR